MSLTRLRFNRILILWQSLSLTRLRFNRVLILLQFLNLMKLKFNRSQLTERHCLDWQTFLSASNTNKSASSTFTGWTIRFYIIHDSHSIPWKDHIEPPCRTAGELHDRLDSPCTMVPTRRTELSERFPYHGNAIWRNFTFKELKLNSAKKVDNASWYSCHCHIPVRRYFRFQRTERLFVWKSQDEYLFYFLTPPPLSVSFFIYPRLCHLV